MPKLDIVIGNRNMSLIYEGGVDGFIELQDSDTNMSLHIRQEDDQLLALHFVEGQSDPVNQLDLDSGDIY
jgi:hypothetical protein